jgi:Uma2 family endonuclease
MSTITSTRRPKVPAAVPAPANVYRMDIDEFERVASFLKAERVELIDGFIVERDKMDPPHVFATDALRRQLDRLIPVGWFVREDKPIRVHATYEPLPDLAIVQGTFASYLKRHPNPADVAIVIEVSDSTVEKDQTEKLVNYAKGGIACYWIVNLVDRRVEVYTGPRRGAYKKPRIFKPGQSVPVVIDGSELGRIAVADILSPEPPGESSGV